MAYSKEVVSCSYPLYSIVQIGNAEFAIAGGGGQAKTGVPNGIELHQIVIDHRNQFFFKCNLQHNMGTDLIMNFIKHPTKNVLGCGINHSISFFQIHYPGALGEDNEIYLSNIESARADFKEKQSYLNALQFNYDGTLIITGGSDGVVRVWKFPSLRKYLELQHHKNEVDHISQNPKVNEVVSLCHKGEALVWDITTGKLINQFSSGSNKYKIKSCRYSPLVGQGPIWLYSGCVPTTIVKHHVPTSYILKFSSSSWKVASRSGALKGLCCALTVSSDGHLVAVGTNDGSVYVVNEDLKILQKFSQVHSVFVTGLVIMDLSPAKQTPDVSELSNNDAKVILSVSADKTCCATKFCRKEKLYLTKALWMSLLTCCLLITFLLLIL